MLVFFTAGLKIPAVIEDATTVVSVAKRRLAFSLLALQTHAISATEFTLYIPRCDKTLQNGDVE